jgi:Transmembrane secretion effector
MYAAFRGPAVVYAAATTASVAAALSMTRVRLRIRTGPRGDRSWKRVLAGMQYIWREKIVLGSISLDLFAVLFGGAVALLPAFAHDILKTGPWGLGLLRCAPAIGAAAVAMLLAYRPLKRRFGLTMFACVAAFGVATILFGLSRNIVVSMIALVLVGATDMVSVVIRGILIQLATPDEMRGRVNAVDMIFIGASNELGQTESGLTTKFLTVVQAIVVGGIASIGVTGLWAWMFPQLRNADRLTTVEGQVTMAEAEEEEKRAEALL